MMQITKVSSLTGVAHTREIPVDPEKLAAWEKGGVNAPHIQHAFPELSDDDREFILSGITPEEWDSMGDGDEGRGQESALDRDLDDEAAF